MSALRSEQLNDLMAGDEWPEFVACAADAEETTVSITVSKDIAWFAGHFPEQAVLPGVVQIHWAAKIAKSIFSGLGDFRIVNNIKFKTMIFPEAKVDIVFAYNPEKQSVKFAYKDSSHIFSTGTLVFSGSDL